jgi:uncharacterized membrane protein
MILDIILKIIQAIVGIALIFIVPGYIIDRYFIKSHTLLEKIVLSITLSLAVTIAIGLILGILHIFNYWNSLICFVLVIILLLVIARFKTALIKRFNVRLKK